MLRYSTLLLLCPLSALAEPFTNLKNCEPLDAVVPELRVADKLERSLETDVRKGLGSMRSYQNACSTYRAGQSATQDTANIQAISSQGQSAQTDGHAAKQTCSSTQDALSKAMISVYKKFSVKPSPASSISIAQVNACINEMKEDQASIAGYQSQLDTSAKAMSSCVLSASNGSVTPNGSGLTPGPQKFTDDASCRTSLFGCLKNPDGTYSVAQRQLAPSSQPTPAPTQSGQGTILNLHPSCPAGSICR